MVQDTFCNRKANALQLVGLRSCACAGKELAKEDPTLHCHPLVLVGTASTGRLESITRGFTRQQWNEGRLR